MNFQVVVRPTAIEDIEKAATWYDEQETGLGNRFLIEVAAAIDGLIPNPFLWRLRNYRLQARWCFPQSFPYRIVFQVEGEVITVVAVTHAAKRDRSWRKRCE